MANHHEVEVDVSMEAMHGSPDQVEQHVPVHILARTVIAAENDGLFTKPIRHEDVMMVAIIDSITSLRCGHPFVNEVVHLLRDTFAADAEDASLSWSQEIDRAWLKKVGRVVHLLGEIERVMHRYRLGARWVRPQTRVHSYKLSVSNLLPVELPLGSHMLKVSLLSAEFLRLHFFTAVHSSENHAIVLLTLPA